MKEKKIETIGYCLRSTPRYKLRTIHQQRYITTIEDLHNKNMDNTLWVLARGNRPSLCFSH